ncbi:MAG TPA: hypothetical protein PLF76_05580, partial [Methanomassiliicoccaceae archaeon]|nr:hypothetical protein [Methanomassiliicoccaceae archaeon]
VRVDGCEGSPGLTTSSPGRREKGTASRMRWVATSTRCDMTCHYASVPALAFLTGLLGQGFSISSKYAHDY